MTQPTGEKKRPPVKWLAPIQSNGKGTFGRPELCSACRGNDDIGVVLNYFLYEASQKADREKIDTSNVQFIPLEKTLDEILEGINHRISKKTLISYIGKLNGWEFVLPHGYHHRYDVYFGKITEAINNPPPAERKKPRGRHVTKVKTTISTISEVKTTIHEENTEDGSFKRMEGMVVLRAEIVELQSRMVKLQSEIVELQSRMVKLQSVQSSESASHLSPIRIFHAPRLLDCNRLIEIKEIDAIVAAHAGDSAPQPSFFENDNLGVDDVTFRIAFEDIRQYHNTQPLESHSQVVTSITVLDAPFLPITEATDGLSLAELGKRPTLPEQSNIWSSETQKQMPVLPVVDTQDKTENDAIAQDNADIPIALESQKTEEIATPGKRSSRGKRAAKPDGEQPAKPTKPALTEEEKALRTQAQEWINTRRGHKLYGRAPVKEIHIERQCVETLAHMLYLKQYCQNDEEGCSWEDLEYVYTYCRDKDKFWSLPENKIRVGAFAVLQKFATAIAMRTQAKNKAQQLARGIVSTATQIAGYTMKPDTDDEDVVYVRKEDRTPRKRA